MRLISRPAMRAVLEFSVLSSGNTQEHGGPGRLTPRSCLHVLLIPGCPYESEVTCP